MNLDVPDLVVIFQAFPVLIKLLQAVLSHLCNPAIPQFGPLIDLMSWIIDGTYKSVAHRVTRRPSFRQCAGSRFSCLQRIKSSIYHIYQQSFSSVPRQKEPVRTRHTIIFFAVSPRKNAALFSGALVVPSSWTFGIESGRDVGSLYGWDDLLPSL